MNTAQDTFPGDGDNVGEPADDDAPGAASASASISIGFPPPQLGAKAHRLAVIGHSPGILALEKPAGLAWDGTAPGTPAILPALRAQLDAGKAELLPFALERPATIWSAETEIHGMALLASRGEPLERWRNALGSALLDFTFELLVPANAARPPRIECALPVALHHNGTRAVISRETGRKSHTLFERQAVCGPWEWWRATTRYPRFHQIRIHAAESSLPIAGEDTYFAPGTPGVPGASAAPFAATRAPVPLPRIEDFLRRGRLNKGEAAPLLDSPALRLASITTPDTLRPSGDPATSATPGDPAAPATSAAPGDPAFPRILRAPIPRKWLALRRRLGA